ncbi:MAG: hypothetical protein F6J86_28075 [Symploca sp. SIO1B1]|nr:hypothetical protein [Symploca sp. SIO1C2]NER97659.1 hypothetical protein [Symploca sp. SIO1B1]
MTNEQLAEIRQRIQELEASDQDFAKKANTLLDEIIVNDQAIESLTRNLNDFITESRRDREADRERIAFNEMRLDVFRERILLQDERFNTIQQNIDRNTRDIAELQLIATQVLQTQQISVQQAEADRAVMTEILQYLRNQYPSNGKGGTSQ